MTPGPAKIVAGAALVILVLPEPGHAYVDPTGGGFLLQLLLGGATGLVVLGRVFFRQLSEKLLRRFRRRK